MIFMSICKFIVVDTIYNTMNSTALEEHRKDCEKNGKYVGMLNIVKLLSNTKIKRLKWQ